MKWVNNYETDSAKYLSASSIVHPRFSIKYSARSIVHDFSLGKIMQLSKEMICNPPSELDKVVASSPVK
jgi:hypothetical protein